MKKAVIGVVLLGVVLLSLFAVLMLNAGTGASWTAVGHIRSGVRAITVASDGRACGYSTVDEHDTVALFSSGRGYRAPRFSPPAYLEPFALGHLTTRGMRMCIPARTGGGTLVSCFGESAQIDERFRLPVTTSSGAFQDRDTLWIAKWLPPGKGIELKRFELRHGSWEEAQSIQPCYGAATQYCSNVEVHATSRRDELVVVPVMGTFDGTHLRYGSILRMNTRTGASISIPVPTEVVPQSLRQELSPIAERFARMIYRSAISADGANIAIIPMLPGRLMDKPKFNELWVRWRGSSAWARIPLPGFVTATTFRGEIPVVVTQDGRVWELRKP